MSMNTLVKTLFDCSETSAASGPEIMCFEYTQKEDVDKLIHENHIRNNV